MIRKEQECAGSIRTVLDSSIIEVSGRWAIIGAFADICIHIHGIFRISWMDYYLQFYQDLYTNLLYTILSGFKH